MDFQVSLAGRGDLATRIYRELLDAIMDGRLRAGERLPPTREFARRLSVSRTTVSTAYDRLTAEGFLTGRVGAGTYVSADAAGRVASRTAPAGREVRPRPLWRSARPPIEIPATQPEYDLTVGVPDPALFPLETWRRLVGRELRESTLGTGGYGDPAGHAGLRAAIARYFGVSRSLHADADDVLVTRGAQQALDLVGRVLIDPGTCVAVEEPGYPPARLLFGSLGARVVGVPVDAEGLVVDAIPAAARLVYATPSHQFPLGTPMSLARRTALLAWAERRGAVVIEDDYDSEFRFSDRPLEPLQSLDRSGRVVYVGSFSKTMLPILRLGFLVAPASLQPALRAAKQLCDWQGELTTQGAMASFMTDGMLARHVRRAGREYATRHELLVRILRRDFSDRLDIVPSAAGLHLATRLVEGTPTDLDAVAARAAAAGVAVERLAQYYGDPTAARPGLVLGYGAIPTARIEPALEILANSFRAASPSHPPGV